MAVNIVGVLQATFKLSPHDRITLWRYFLGVSRLHSSSWRRLWPLITAAALALPTCQTVSPEADFDYGLRPSEADYLGINQTSSGMASGLATPDGRPLLWKNRDRGGASPVEFHYVSDGRIPFVAVTDVNDTARYYSGVNAEAFAIENTDNHNIPDQGGVANDGITMRMALAICRTVDDFAALLDSADRRDVLGRAGYDYGVIDAYGGAAIFETQRWGYHRFDAVEAPGGFLIRTNFSYTGEDTSGQDSYYGLHRHARAMELFKTAVELGTLTPQYIFAHVSRDLTSAGFDPYPLPFRGYEQSYPYGCVDNSTAICRATTTAVTVAQGVREGERPEGAILWSMNGNPLTGIMTPLWVRAGSIPPEYDGVERSRMNNRIIDLYYWVYSGGRGGVDTWKLSNPDGSGLWDYVLPLEGWIFSKTDEFLRSQDFSLDRLRPFENEMAQQITDSLVAWRPTFKVTDLASPVFWDNHVTLYWGEIVPPDSGRQEMQADYKVYRSSEPFRENAHGDLLATVNGTTFTDDHPLTGAAFYQVVCEMH
jgi:hypothetical protein